MNQQENRQLDASYASGVRPGGEDTRSADALSGAPRHSMLQQTTRDAQTNVMVTPFIKNNYYYNCPNFEKFLRDLHNETTCIIFDFEKISVNTTALMYELDCGDSIILSEICEYIAVSDSTCLTMMELIELLRKSEGNYMFFSLWSPEECQQAITTLIDIFTAYEKFKSVPNSQGEFGDLNEGNELVDHTVDNNFYEDRVVHEFRLGEILVPASPEIADEVPSSYDEEINIPPTPDSQSDFESSPDIREIQEAPEDTEYEPPTSRRKLI